MNKMSIKTSIQHIIKCSLDNMDLPDKINLSNIIVEKPSKKENGDYSSNIALILTKVLKKSPMIIAEEIVNNMKTEINNDWKGYLRRFKMPSTKALLWPTALIPVPSGKRPWQT